MKATNFLGPFRNLPNYQDKSLLDEMTSDKTVLQFPYPLHECCYFDFDVRPQRTCLANGEKLRLADNKVDWDEVLHRCILSVARTTGISKSGYKLELGVEGECDNGSVTCWVLVKKPSRKVFTAAVRGITERIKRQKWPRNSPEWVPPFGHVERNNLPGQDRISIQVMDPKTQLTIPMLAENFCFVNQGKDFLDSFVFSEWDFLVGSVNLL